MPEGRRNDLEIWFAKIQRDGSVKRVRLFSWTYTGPARRITVTE